VIKKISIETTGQVISQFFSPYHAYQYIRTKCLLDRFYYFKPACKPVNIEGLRLHDLRHMAAARMTLSASIVAASKILGHADIEMTLIYSHPDNSLIEAVDDLAKFESSTTNFAADENLQNSD
jgi:integrase